MTTWGFAGLHDAGRNRPAVVVGERFSWASEVTHLPHDTFDDLFASWDEAVGAIDAVVLGRPEIHDAWSPLADRRFGLPTVDRPTVYCAGANYRDHALEMGDTKPAPPYHFVTPLGSLNVQGAQVVRPRGVHKLDWEVELAVVIGRGGRDIPPNRALEHVAGYTIANDISVRDPAMFHSIFGVDWMIAKNGAGLTPLGPRLIPASQLDLRDLRISLTVNGQVMQSSSTAELISGVDEQIARLSALLPLFPGDVILTGTPAGTAAAHGRYLQPGDTVIARVEGIGELRNTIVDPAQVS